MQAENQQRATLQLAIRFTGEIAEQITQMAKDRNISCSAFAKVILAEGIKNEIKKAQANA